MAAADGKAVWNRIGPGGARETVQHQPRYVADDLLTLKFALLAGTGRAGCPTTCARTSCARESWCALPDWTTPEGIFHAVFPFAPGWHRRCANFSIFAEMQRGKVSLA